MLGGVFFRLPALYYRCTLQLHNDNAMPAAGGRRVDGAERLELRSGEDDDKRSPTH